MGQGISNLFARFSPATTDLAARRFLQRRIALFVAMMICSYAVLLTLVNILYTTYPVTRPARATLINYMAFGCFGVGVILWLALRRKTIWSANVLVFFDVFAMFMMSSTFILAGILADDKEANTWSAFIWMSLSVFSRVLVIPSSWQRTLAASSVGIAPTMLATAVIKIQIPTAPLMAGAVVFCLIIVTLSTLGSHIIYGLRAQVSEAMQLGQYTLLDKIGEGGMGTVYTARHAMLRRPTAIKLLRTDKTRADSLQRFQREVQLTSELTHPNTVAIYDYGRSPDGLFYYAMEYLDGVDLQTLVEWFGPLPWERVAHILRQICGSIEEAHARGLIHRDIKPSNVILCKRGGIPDVVKVLDFGLVKELDRVDGDSKVDTIAGTPAYLPPEAVTTPEKVGASSDLYSIGAVGYFLVTGTELFSGQTHIEICMHHVQTEPVPPSERLGYEIPASFEQLLLRCLAKDPTERPGSARELRMALADTVEDGEWTEARAAKWWDDSAEKMAELKDRSPACSTSMVTVDVASRSDTSEEIGRLRTIEG